MNNHVNNTNAICCPKCKCDAVRRVPRPVLVKSLLGFLPLRRYQCLSCLSTFMGSVNNHKQTVKLELGNTSAGMLIGDVLQSRAAFPNA